MLYGHVVPDAAEDLREIVAAVMARDFVDDHDLLRPLDLDGKCRAASRHERGMGLLGGGLDVLRVVVAAANDDQVLQTPGDVQMAVEHEAQVPGAKERALAGVGQPRPERLLVLLAAVPVAAGDVRTLDPDFPNAIGRRRAFCRRRRRSGSYGR